MKHETMDVWNACVSRLVATGAPVVAEWPAAERRRIRFDARAERDQDLRQACCTTDQQVLDAFAVAGPMTTLQLSLELGCSLTTAYKRLRRLRDAGTLTQPQQRAA
jgi:hypothetical protein